MEEIKTKIKGGYAYLIANKAQLINIVFFAVSIAWILKDIVIAHTPDNYIPYITALYSIITFILTHYDVKQIKVLATIVTENKAIIDIAQSVITSVLDDVGKDKLSDEVNEGIDKFQEAAAEVVKVE